MKNCKDCENHLPGCRTSCEYWIKHEQEKAKRYKEKSADLNFREYQHAAVLRMTRRKG